MTAMLSSRHSQTARPVRTGDQIDAKDLLVVYTAD